MDCDSEKETFKIFGLYIRTKVHQTISNIKTAKMYKAASIILLFLLIIYCQKGSSENLIVNPDGSLTFNGIKYMPVEPVIQESRSVDIPILDDPPCECNDDDCSNCDYLLELSLL